MFCFSAPFYLDIGAYLLMIIYVLFPAALRRIPDK